MASPAFSESSFPSFLESYAQNPAPSTFEAVFRQEQSALWSFAPDEEVSADSLPPQPQADETAWAPAADPAFADSAPAVQDHTVASGETMHAIARDFGVSLDALAAANPEFAPNSADGRYNAAHERNLIRNGSGGRDLDFIAPGEHIRMPATIALPLDDATGMQDSAPPVDSPADTLPHLPADSIPSSPQPGPGAATPAPTDSVQQGPVESWPTPAALPARSAPVKAKQEQQAQAPAAPVRRQIWSRSNDVGLPVVQEGNVAVGGAVKLGFSVVKRLEKGDLIRETSNKLMQSVGVDPAKARAPSSKTLQKVGSTINAIEQAGNGTVSVGKLAVTKGLSKVYGFGGLAANAMDIKVSAEKGDTKGVVTNSAELVRAGADAWKSVATIAKPFADKVATVTYVTQGVVEMDAAYGDLAAGKIDRKEAAGRVFDGAFSSTMGALQYVPATSGIAYTVNTSIGIVEGGAALTGHKVDVGRSLYSGLREGSGVMLYSNPATAPLMAGLILSGHGKEAGKIAEGVKSSMDQGMITLGKAVNTVGSWLGFHK